MPTATTIDEYVAQAPEPARAALAELLAAVRAAAPGSAERIRYGMPAIELAPGRWLHLGAWKRHIGVYPVPALPEALEERVRPYRTTRATVRLPLRAEAGYGAEAGHGTEAGYAAEAGYGAEAGYAAEAGYGGETGHGTEAGHGAETGHGAEAALVAEVARAIAAGTGTGRPTPQTATSGPGDAPGGTRARPAATALHTDHGTPAP